MPSDLAVAMMHELLNAFFTTKVLFFIQCTRPDRSVSDGAPCRTPYKSLTRTPDPRSRTRPRTLTVSQLIGVLSDPSSQNPGIRGYSLDADDENVVSPDTLLLEEART